MSWHAVAPYSHVTPPWIVPVIIKWPLDLVAPDLVAPDLMAPDLDNYDQQCVTAQRNDVLDRSITEKLIPEP